MKTIILTTLLVFAGVVGANAQIDCTATPEKCALVPQEVLDLANQAAKEVKVLRELADAQKQAIEALQRELEAKNQLIKAKQDLIDQQKERIEFLVNLKCSVTELKFIFVIRKKQCFE